MSWFVTKFFNILHRTGPVFFFCSSASALYTPYLHVGKCVTESSLCSAALWPPQSDLPVLGALRSMTLVASGTVKYVHPVCSISQTVVFVCRHDEMSPFPACCINKKNPQVATCSAIISFSFYSDGFSISRIIFHSVLPFMFELLLTVVKRAGGSWRSEETCWNVQTYPEHNKSLICCGRVYLLHLKRNACGLQQAEVLSHIVHRLAESQIHCSDTQDVSFSWISVSILM